MRGREEVGLSIPRAIVDTPVVIKTLKHLTSGNKNHNYTACLFIL